MSRSVSVKPTLKESLLSDKTLIYIKLNNNFNKEACL